MVAANWDAAYKVYRVYEGGNDDDPKDPGGRTSRGVTQRTYNAYRKAEGMAPRDVYLATEDEVSEIYRKQYADIVHFDELRSGVDLVVGDGAIHSGPKQSLVWLQRALKNMDLYAGEIDGVWGVQTAGAAKAVKDDDLLILKILDLRFAFMKKLKNWEHAKRGWTSRIQNLLKVGQSWASGSVGGELVIAPVPGGNEKAPAPSVVKPTTQAQTGTNTGVTGGAIVVITQTIQQTKDALTPYSGQWSFVDKALVALTIAGGVVLVGGMAYSWWKGRKAQRAADLAVGITA